MKAGTFATVLIGLLSASVIAACGGSSGATNTAAAGGASSVDATLNGAGSTFAAPIYQQWASTLKASGLTINYDPVGSGTGVADLQSATVDFAGSDPALQAADRSGMKGPVLQFPLAFGAITVSYNLPGVKSGLKLDGTTLAEIFSGGLTRWNAPAIAALNPGLRLPSAHITVVHRSDSSGTTEGFTTYLSDVDPTWSKSIGSGKLVKWPVGSGASGNSGVAAAVKQTDGAVGYVEQAYALLNGFTYAAIKNGSTYVLPTIANTSAAAADVKVGADLGLSTINSTAPGSYPITSQTFLITYADPCKDGGASDSTAKGLRKFLQYAFTNGQRTLGGGSGQLPYAPLPGKLIALNLAALQRLTCNGAKL